MGWELWDDLIQVFSPYSPWVVYKGFLNTPASYPHFCTHFCTHFPAFSQDSERSLTAQNPFSPILITVLHSPFGELPKPYSRAFVFQGPELLPSLNQSSTCDPGLASHGITSPNYVIGSHSTRVEPGNMWGALFGSSILGDESVIEI